MMNKFEIRYARKIVKGKDYCFRRMERMSNMTAYWIRCAQDANCTLRRKTCYEMAKIYNKRYNYYLNKE